MAICASDARCLNVFQGAERLNRTTLSRLFGLHSLKRLISLCTSYLSLSERWGTGVVIWLERGADLHMAQLTPLPLTVSCFIKIQIGFTFLVPAHPDSPGQRVVKRVCVPISVVTGVPSPAEIVSGDSQNWLMAAVRVHAEFSGLFLIVFLSSVLHTRVFEF